MIVLRAHWLCPVLTAAAMAAPSLSQSGAVSAMFIIAGLWILVELTATIRALRDCASMGSRPASLLVAIGLTSPLPALLATGVIAMLAVPDTTRVLQFFWHLLTRT